MVCPQQSGHDEHHVREEHSQIHHGKHPGCKQWHCIDYIIMRQKQRGWCSDVTVLRSADCWTDHKLLCAQMKFSILPGRMATSERSTILDIFSQSMCELVKGKWDDDLKGLDMWDIISDSMKETAQEDLRWERRKQPDTIVNVWKS